jgi:hypothetical protein
MMQLTVLSIQPAILTKVLALHGMPLNWTSPQPPMVVLTALFCLTAMSAASGVLPLRPASVMPCSHWPEVAWSAACQLPVNPVQITPLASRQLLQRGHGVLLCPVGQSPADARQAYAASHGLSAQ